jgi:transposase
MLAMCSGVYRLSRRTVEGLMADFFNVDISLGSVSACEGTVSDAVAEPVAGARKYVEAAPVVHADETGYRQAVQPDETPPAGKAPAKSKAWLWVAVTAYVTTFLVHARRNTAAARELLGSFAGVLVSDRWSAYNFIDAARRQLCSRAPAARL